MTVIRKARHGFIINHNVDLSELRSSCLKGSVRNEDLEYFNDFVSGSFVGRCRCKTDDKAWFSALIVQSRYGLFEKDYVSSQQNRMCRI